MNDLFAPGVLPPAHPAECASDLIALWRSSLDPDITRLAVKGASLFAEHYSDDVISSVDGPFTSECGRLYWNVIAESRDSGHVSKYEGLRHLGGGLVADPVGRPFRIGLPIDRNSLASNEALPAVFARASLFGWGRNPQAEARVVERFGPDGKWLFLADGRIAHAQQWTTDPRESPDMLAPLLSDRLQSALCDHTENPHPFIESLSVKARQLLGRYHRHLFARLEKADASDFDAVLDAVLPILSLDVCYTSIDRESADAFSRLRWSAESVLENVPLPVKDAPVRLWISDNKAFLRCGNDTDIPLYKREGSWARGFLEACSHLPTSSSRVKARSSRCSSKPTSVTARDVNAQDKDDTRLSRVGTLDLGGGRFVGFVDTDCGGWISETGYRSFLCGTPTVSNIEVTVEEWRRSSITKKTRRSSPKGYLDSATNPLHRRILESVTAGEPFFPSVATCLERVLSNHDEAVEFSRLAKETLETSMADSNRYPKVEAFCHRFSHFRSCPEASFLIARRIDRLGNGFPTQLTESGVISFVRSDSTYDGSMLSPSVPAFGYSHPDEEPARPPGGTGSFSPLLDASNFASSVDDDVTLDAVPSAEPQNTPLKSLAFSQLSFGF